MDSPKMLRDPDALATRLALVDEAHVAPLSNFVRRLRARMGPDAAIPFFDPWDGGVNAEVLFLFEAPGPKARSSGFVSMNNPDETAKNTHGLSRAAGIDRERLVLWNVVPWYIGSDTRIRPAGSIDVDAGMESLEELLGCLPRLRAVVLAGRKAQRAARHLERVAPGLKLFSSPHPSPLFVNRELGNRETLLAKWKAVGTFLEG